MFFILMSLFIGQVHAQSASLNTEEAAFLEIINDFRAQLHLGQLTIDRRLTAAAEGHAVQMANYNKLTHVGYGNGQWTSASRMYGEGIKKGTLVGENIARGSFTAKDSFIQWFFSSAHLGGMLTPEYTHIGIVRRGCDEEDNSYWRCFWVTDFRGDEPMGSSSTQTGSESEESIHEEASIEAQPEISYADRILIQAAENVVGELPAQKKASFVNPTE